MLEEATYPYPAVGGNQQQFSTVSSPQVAMNYFQRVPTEYTVDSLLEAAASAGGITQTQPDPHSTGGGSMEVVAAAARQRQPEIESMEVNAALDPFAGACADILHHLNPGVSQTQLLPPYYAGAGEEEEEIVQSGTTGSPLLDFNMQEFSAGLTPTTAAVNRDILSVDGAGAPRDGEPNRLLLLVKDPYSYPTGGDSTCPSTTTTTAAAGMGISSPDLLEVNNQHAGLPQSGSGGGAASFTEAPPERGSCKRKYRCSWISKKADVVPSDPSSAGVNLRRSTDIRPPDGSTPTEIIQFLIREWYSGAYSTGCSVNRRIAEQDQTAPVAPRRYVTTMRMNMMAESLKVQHGGDGYWQPKTDYEVIGTIGFCYGMQLTDVIVGIKRTFRFHTSDGTETNWFMNEYIPTTKWGIDHYFEGLHFREVFEVAGKQRVKTSNRIATVKHRMRGPDDPIMVVKGESAAWQDMIKIYDRHPELEGSKVVYAVCCHCQGVLRAGTENGTSSLLTHSKRTCPNRNKNQQQASSSR